MHSGRKFKLFQTIKWTRRSILVFILWSSIVVIAHELLGMKWVMIPWLPVALIGTALAFYLGFKNNSSYDRLWEGRKIWGGIVNASRTWVMKVIDFPDYEEENRESLIRDFTYTHLAWLTSLRFALRTPRDWEHHDKENEKRRKDFFVPEYKKVEEEELKKYLPDQEIIKIYQTNNHATHLIKLQSHNLKRLQASGALDSFTYLDMASTLKDLYDLQGQCERIKNFPLPRQYASTSMIFVQIFLMLLPLGLIGEFAQISHQITWMVIPFSTLISWVFHTMELIGDYSENPFEGLANDVPISNLCRTIEIDLKQMIGDDSLPEEYPSKKQIMY